MSLSVIIMAKNEEKNIRACIESVRFADEIILIDDYSTDNTVAIARELGAVVYQRAMNGDYGAQQTYGIEQARMRWALFLDADERVTPELAAEIKQKAGSDELYAYKIPFLNHAMGIPLWHGDWYPDYIVRLVPRQGSRVEGKVHQEIIHNYEIKKLQNHILHYTYTSWEQYFNKFNTYTKLAAEKNWQNGKRAGFLGDIILRPAFSFFKMYILKSGWRDGRIGFILAVYHYFYTMTKYVKLYYIQEEREDKK